MDFLGVADILMLHADQVALYGGDLGVRDIGLLESAAAQPRATFGGQFLHADVFEMAAAYLFHLVQNHPFVDGNKRTGAITAMVFLDFNGAKLRLHKGELYELTMSVATGRAGKKEIAEFFRKRGHIRENGSGSNL
jgi:death on curing protein